MRYNHIDFCTAHTNNNKYRSPEMLYGACNVVVVVVVVSVLELLYAYVRGEFVGC